MAEEIHAFVDVLDVKDIAAPFFKEGEVVTIKKFSYADRQFLSGEYTKLSAAWQREGDGTRKGDGKEKQDATVTSEIILGKMNMSILDRGVKSWTLYDRDGKEVTYSRRTTRKLTDPYAEFILGEINDFNPTGSSDEDGDDEDDDFFLGAGGGGEGGG